MNYFDKEIITDLKTHNIGFQTLTDAEHKIILEEMNNKIPFSSSKIDWKILKNSHIFFYEPLSIATLQLAEKIREVSDGNLIFVGDSACDEVYSIAPESLEQALKLFSELPQHTYILQTSLNWIACISFEGDIDFAGLP